MVGLPSFGVVYWPADPIDVSYMEEGTRASASVICERRLAISLSLAASAPEKYNPRLNQPIKIG